MSGILNLFAPAPDSFPVNVVPITAYNLPYFSELCNNEPSQINQPVGALEPAYIVIVPAGGTTVPTYVAISVGVVVTVVFSTYVSVTDEGDKVSSPCTVGIGSKPVNGSAGGNFEIGAFSVAI